MYWGLTVDSKSDLEQKYTVIFFGYVMYKPLNNAEPSCSSGRFFGSILSPHTRHFLDLFVCLYFVIKDTCRGMRRRRHDSRSSDEEDEGNVLCF